MRTQYSGTMIDHIAAFLDSHIDGQVECFLLSGSTARDERGSDSDIDVVVLCASVPQSIKRCVCHDGFLYDLKIHDLETILFELDMAQHSTCFAMLPSMIAESVVHPAGHPLGEMIRNKAKSMLASGPKPSPERVLELQHDMSSGYYTLARATTTPEMKMTIALHNFQTACMFLCLARGRFISGGKWLPRIMPEIAPKEFAALTEGLKTGVCSGDWEPFRDALLMVIEAEGGLLTDGYEVKMEPGRRKRFSIPLG